MADPTTRAVEHHLGMIEVIIREHLGDAWLVAHPEVPEAAKRIAATVRQDT
jgi:hypothetical protein